MGSEGSILGRALEGPQAGVESIAAGDPVAPERQVLGGGGPGRPGSVSSTHGPCNRKRNEVIFFPGLSLTCFQAPNLSHFPDSPGLRGPWSIRSLGSGSTTLCTTGPACLYGTSPVFASERCQGWAGLGGARL